MKKTVRISRPASGVGTVVTVTLVEDGITATYNLRSSATGIAQSVKACTSQAEDMLRQVREAL